MSNTSDRVLRHPKRLFSDGWSKMREKVPAWYSKSLLRRRLHTSRVTTNNPTFWGSAARTGATTTSVDNVGSVSRRRDSSATTGSRRPRRA